MGTVEIGTILIWILGGIVAGMVAGLLGIGGGTLVVPMLVATGLNGLPATATSNLAILLTATSGSLRNWRVENLDLVKVLALGIPAAIAGQLGVFLASDVIPDYLLLTGFALLLLLNVYLISLKKQAIAKVVEKSVNDPPSAKKQLHNRNSAISRLATGGTAGLMAGLFGVGGGVIMVPLQILLLDEPIKAAIQTSLGAIVLTSLFNTIGHAFRGNVMWFAGIAVGCGGLLGAQLGTHFLPKLPNRVVGLLFRGLMLILSVFTFFKAWQAFLAS